MVHKHSGIHVFLGTSWVLITINTLPGVLATAGCRLSKTAVPCEGGDRSSVNTHLKHKRRLRTGMFFSVRVVCISVRSTPIAVHDTRCIDVRGSSAIA